MVRVLFDCILFEYVILLRFERFQDSQLPYFVTSLSSFLSGENKAKIVFLPCGESNPGRGGESAES